MKILLQQGREDLASVFVAELDDGRVEFVESLSPPIPREEKWVLIVSTLIGCPFACALCDAGGSYAGRLAKEEILAQIDFLIRRRFPEGRVPIPKLKIQFARMGEPALNPAVLDVLRELPRRYDAPGLLPCLSTIAPRGRESFFEELLRIKDALYPGGRFQMQFSLHSTDERSRRNLMAKTLWSLQEISAYGQRFVRPGDRKVALNFALIEGVAINPEVLQTCFDPGRFLVKLTPLNPTYRAKQSGLHSAWANRAACVRELKRSGFEVIESYGEEEENLHRTNCGQLVRASRPGSLWPLDIRLAHLV